MARSVKVLSMHIAFLVPLSFTNPHCFSVIYGDILFLILAIIIFSKVYDIRLIVRCDSHSVAPGFFGKAIKMEFDKSEGISPLSYMAFRKSVNISIPNSSRLSIISTVILFGPAALSFSIDVTIEIYINIIEIYFNNVLLNANLINNNNNNCNKKICCICFLINLK